MNMLLKILSSIRLSNLITPFIYSCILYFYTQQDKAIYSRQKLNLTFILRKTYAQFRETNMDLWISGEILKGQKTYFEKLP